MSRTQSEGQDATSHRRRRVGAALAVPLTAGAYAVVAASPAGAACTGNHWADTNGNNPNRNYTIAGGSCVDLNHHEATVGQEYRAEYLSGGTWRVGSGGWKYRDPNTTGGYVAISNIATGSTVRSTGAAVNAFIHVQH